MKDVYSLILALLIPLILLAGCKSELGCIEKNESKADSSLALDAFKYKKILLERFNETSIENQEYDAYHLQFYSSHGFGESIKFQKQDSIFSLTVICIKKVDWPSKCKDLKIEISKDDWDGLEKIIDEFDFWTEPQFRKNENVLDGFVYFLEGKSTQVIECNKKYQITARSSPAYDKIGALCNYILEYKIQLTLKYSQQNHL